MKKETLIVHTESRAAKEMMLQDFRESWEETMSCEPFLFPRYPDPVLKHASSFSGTTT